MGSPWRAWSVPLVRLQSGHPCGGGMDRSGGATVARLWRRLIRSTPAVTDRTRLSIEPGELRGGVHDATADDGENGSEPADIVGRDSEVIVAEDDEVGMLADFQRSYPSLLHQIPGAAGGLGAKRLLPSQPLFGRNARHGRIERLPADHVPEVDERWIRRDVHCVRRQAKMDSAVEHALETGSPAAPERHAG